MPATIDEEMNATDIEALHALYIGNRQELFTYAVSITGNREAAEDAIHGVFERLLCRDDLPNGILPYVFRAVRNAAYDARRRTKVRSDSVFQLTVAAEVVGTGTADRVRPEELEALLQQLPPDERETIVLKIHGGLTFQQIAEFQGAPLPTVASWYRRGIDRLRNVVNREC